MDEINKNHHEIEINQIKEIFSIYSILIQGEHEAYSNKNLKMQFPILPLPALTYLVESSTNIFSQEPTMLELSSPICIVGDIHGQIIDLFRILKFCGKPLNRRYLFLGDFIDRGHFSLETLILVYSLKLLFPSEIFIVRGNHEFDNDGVLDHSIFCSEIESIYGNCPIYNLFIKSFSFLPLAAKIDHFFLCLHGGISEDFISVDQIRSIERPIVDYKKGIVQGILWSDPIDNPDIDFKESVRGYGRLFGIGPVKNFLEENGLRFIVRGHQCKKRGFESSCGGHVLTVFSASNYFGVEENRSGVLLIQPRGVYKTKTFPPFNEIMRDEATFLTIEEYRAGRNKSKVTSSRSTKNQFKSIQPKSNKVEIENQSKMHPIPANNFCRQKMKPMNNQRQIQIKPNAAIEKRKNSPIQRIEEKIDSPNSSSFSLLNGTRRKAPTLFNPANANRKKAKRRGYKSPNYDRKVRNDAGNKIHSS